MDLVFPLIEFGLPPGLLWGGFDFLHELGVVLRCRHGPEHGGREGILGRVSVLEKGEESIDLGMFELGVWRGQWFALCGSGRLGSGGLGSGGERLQAVRLAMMLDGAREGQVWAQGVLWPEGKDARVLRCYLRRCQCKPGAMMRGGSGRTVEAMAGEAAQSLNCACMQTSIRVPPWVLDGQKSR